MVEQKKLLSVTDLSSYLYCPRKFFMQKIKGIRKPPTKVMVEGQIRHNVVELFSNNEAELVGSLKPMESKDISLAYLSMLNDIIRRTFLFKSDIMKKFSIDLKEMKDNIVVGLNEDILLRSNAVEQGMKQGFSGYSLWENLEPKYISEYSIISERLGLKGKIDRVMMSKDKIIPFELKTRAVDRIYESDELQLTAYAMLLEEQFKKPIPEGILEAGNKKHFIPIQEKMRNKVLQLINEITFLTSAPNLPSNFSKCQKCDYKEECDKLE